MRDIQDKIRELYLALWQLLLFFFCLTPDHNRETKNKNSVNYHFISPQKCVCVRETQTNKLILIPWEMSHRCYCTNNKNQNKTSSACTSFWGRETSAVSPCLLGSPCCHASYHKSHWQTCCLACTAWKHRTSKPLTLAAQHIKPSRAWHMIALVL